MRLQVLCPWFLAELQNTVSDAAPVLTADSARDGSSCCREQLGSHWYAGFNFPIGSGDQADCTYYIMCTMFFESCTVPIGPCQSTGRPSEMADRSAAWTDEKSHRLSLQ